jgi:PEP-CTERM motif-containing protein
MRVLRLAILTLALSFSVIGAAWANGDLADADLNGTPVPEPGSLVLLLTGIGAGAAVFFRRRK